MVFENPRPWVDWRVVGTWKWTRCGCDRALFFFIITSFLLLFFFFLIYRESEMEIEGS